MVGYDSDTIVDSEDAVDMGARHKVIYSPAQHGMSHFNIHQQTSGVWVHRYSNDFGRTFTAPAGNAAAPVRVANNACYWHSAW